LAPGETEPIEVENSDWYRKPGLIFLEMSENRTFSMSVVLFGLECSIIVFGGILKPRGNAALSY
jgi:hypothetical protein